MKFLIVDIRKRVGNLKTPHYAVERIQSVLSSKNIPSDLCHYDEIGTYVENGQLNITAKNTPLTDYTHIIMRGHRTNEEYMLKRFVVDFTQNKGIFVQNAEFIKTLSHYNKITQMELFALNDIPYPDSYYNVDGRYWEKKDALSRIGFPLIYKHITGEYRIEKIDGKPKTKKNVFLVKSAKELKSECEKRDNPQSPFISKPSQYFIQKYAEIGEDYRAIMIGGKFLSGWKREATKNFLTVSKGSTYSLYDKPSSDFLDLAERAAEAARADYCAVDIIYINNTPHVLEINMNPGFKAFETKIEGANVDVATAIVDQMLAK